MEDPLISILIPTYNSSKYLEATIMCAINQTYSNLEIIIQDDGSIDTTLEIARKKANEDNRISVFSNQKNLGMCKNWNSLFKKANGKYILKLDADDLISVNFIGILLEKATISDADIISAAYAVLDNNSNNSRKINYHNQLEEGLVKNLLSTIIFHNPFHLVFSLIKREFLERTTAGNEYFMETEVGDAEFLIKSALNNCNLYFIPIVLGYYRMHESNSSREPLKQIRSFYFDVLPKHHNALKQNKSFNYQKKLNIDLFDYLKQLIKLRSPLNIMLVYQMIKLRF